MYTEIIVLFYKYELLIAEFNISVLWFFFQELNGDVFPNDGCLTTSSHFNAIWHAFDIFNEKCIQFFVKIEFNE